jgi:hypothetical protein
MTLRRLMLLGRRCRQVLQRSRLFCSVKFIRAKPGARPKPSTHKQNPAASIHAAFRRETEGQANGDKIHPEWESRVFGIAS